MRPPLLKRLGVPLLVLVACGLSTLALTVHTARSVRALEQERFRSAASNVSDRIAGRLDIYLALLRGARALYASDSNGVTGDEFRAYVDTLKVRERYPGIQGIGFAAREGESYPIRHLEPLDERNRVAIGYDMYGDPTRRAAMESARDSGRVVMSGKVTLRQEIDRHPQQGFLIYLPIYGGGDIPATVAERRARITGFVYSPFRAGDLLEGIFGRDTPAVAFQIFDGDEAAPAGLLYATRSQPPPAMTHRERLEIASHVWTLMLWPVHPEAFAASSERALVWVVAVLGLAISFALFLITRYQVKTRAAAEREELRQREEARASETLRRVGASLAAELERDKLVQLITNEATALTGAKFGAFSPTFDGVGVVRSDDITRDPRYGKSEPYHGMPPGLPNVTSYLAVPVVSQKGAVIGGLFFGHPEAGKFTAQHERLVSGLAAQAAIALDNARLYGEVRDADRRKDEFLALLAHELRNPLAPVLTAVHLMEQKAPAGQSIERERDVVVRQVRHMSRMIDDLLDLSRISRGKIELKKETLDLVTSSAAALEVMRPLAHQRGHRLVHEVPSEPIWLEADPLRIEQILTNLMTNAIKYTEPGGVVTVTLGVEQGRAWVRVRDTGIGIAADELPRIFEPFVQGDRRLDRAQGGLGIGLSLVKSLAEMHNGRVSASSAGKGQGAEFVIDFPTVPASQAPVHVPREASAPVAAANVQGTRVLVVDDNVEAAELLTDVLRDCGHSVEMAHDGQAAIALAEKFHPEVVLLDIGLPEIDGYEVARRLRGKEELKDVMLVALTGYGQASDRRKSVAAGFDKHLVKPVDADTIISIVQSLRD